MPVVTPHVPDGLIDLMKTLTKSILKERPENIYEFAVEHFEKLITQRDGSLDKGYEHFQAWEDYFKAEEKLQKSIKINRFQDKRSSKSGEVDSYEGNSETDLQTTTPQPVQRKHFKARNFSSRKPSETLLAIKEDDGEEAARKEIDEEMRRREWAAFKIQKAFRKFFAKTKNIGSGLKKKMTEQMAALIIQRTLRSLFQQRLSQKAKNLEKGADATNIDESILPVYSMTKLAAPLRQNSDDQHPSIAFGERCTEDNAKQEPLLVGGIDDIKEHDSEDELSSDITSVGNSVCISTGLNENHEADPVSQEQESLAQLLKDVKNGESEKEPRSEETETERATDVEETVGDTAPDTARVPDVINVNQIDGTSTPNIAIEKESLTQILKNENKDKPAVLELNESHEASMINTEDSVEADGKDDDTQSQNDEDAIQNVIATASSDEREPLISDDEQLDLVSEHLTVEQESLVGILKEQKKDKVHDNNVAHGEDELRVEDEMTTAVTAHDAVPSIKDNSNRDESYTNMIPVEETMSKVQIVDLKEASVDKCDSDGTSLLNPEIGSTSQSAISNEPSTGPTIPEDRPASAVQGTNYSADQEKSYSEESNKPVQIDITESVDKKSTSAVEPQAQAAGLDTAEKGQSDEGIEIKEEKISEVVAENQLSKQQSIEKESLSKLLKEERENREQEPINEMISTNDNCMDELKDGYQTPAEVNVKVVEGRNGSHFSAVKSESEPNVDGVSSKVEPNELLNIPHEDESQTAVNESSKPIEEQLDDKNLFVVDTVNSMEQKPTEQLQKIMSGEEIEDKTEVHNQLEKEAPDTPTAEPQLSIDVAKEDSTHDSKSHINSEQALPNEHELKSTPANTEPFLNPGDHGEISATDINPVPNDQIMEIPTISVDVAESKMEKGTKKTNDESNEKNDEQIPQNEEETIPSAVSVEKLQASPNEQPQEIPQSDNLPEKKSEIKSQSVESQKENVITNKQHQSPMFGNQETLEELNPLNIIEDSTNGKPEFICVDGNKLPEDLETDDKARKVHAQTSLFNKPGEELLAVVSDVFPNDFDSANNGKESVENDVDVKNDSLEVKEYSELGRKNEEISKSETVEAHEIGDNHLDALSVNNDETTIKSSQVKQASEDITKIAHEGGSNITGSNTLKTDTKTDQTSGTSTSSENDNSGDILKLSEEQNIEKTQEERSSVADTIDVRNDTEKQEISETSTSAVIGNIEKSDDVSQLTSLDSIEGVVKEPAITNNVEGNNEGTEHTTSKNTSKSEDADEVTETTESTNQIEQTDTKNKNSDDIWNEESLAKSLHDFKGKAHTDASGPQRTELSSNEAVSQNNRTPGKDELVGPSGGPEMGKSETFHAEIQPDSLCHFDSSINHAIGLLSLEEKTDEFLDSLEPYTANNANVNIESIAEVHKDDDGSISEAELTGLIVENGVNKENEAGNPPQRDNHSAEKEEQVANHPGKVAEPPQNTFNTVESRPLEGGYNANVIGKQLVDAKNDVELIDDEDGCNNVPDLKLCDTNKSLDKASDDKEIVMLKSSDSKMRTKRSAPKLLDEPCFSKDEAMIEEGQISQSKMGDHARGKMNDVLSLESAQPEVPILENHETNLSESQCLDGTMHAKENNETPDLRDIKEVKENCASNSEELEKEGDTTKSQREVLETSSPADFDLTKYDRSDKRAPNKNTNPLNSSILLEQSNEEVSEGSSKVYQSIVPVNTNEAPSETSKINKKEDKCLNSTESTINRDTSTKKCDVATEDDHSQDMEELRAVSKLPIESDIIKEPGKSSESDVACVPEDGETIIVLRNAKTIDKIGQHVGSAEPSAKDRSTNDEVSSNNNVPKINVGDISDSSEASVEEEPVPETSFHTDKINVSCSTKNDNMSDNSITETSCHSGTEKSVSEAEISKREIANLSASGPSQDSSQPIDTPRSEVPDNTMDATVSNSDATNTENALEDGNKSETTLADQNLVSEYNFPETPTEEQRGADTSHQLVEYKNAATENLQSVSESRENEKVDADSTNPTYSDKQNREELISKNEPIPNLERISGRKSVDSISLQLGKDGPNVERPSNDDSVKGELLSSQVQNGSNSGNVEVVEGNNEVLDNPTAIMAELVGDKLHTRMEVKEEAEQNGAIQIESNIPVAEERDADGRMKTELPKQDDMQNTRDESHGNDPAELMTDKNHAISDSHLVIPDKDNTASATEHYDFKGSDGGSPHTINTEKSSTDKTAFNISSDSINPLDSKTKIQNLDKPQRRNSSEEKIDQDQRNNHKGENMSSGSDMTEIQSNTLEQNSEEFSDRQAHMEESRTLDLSTKSNELFHLDLDNHSEEEALKSEVSIPMNSNVKSETFEDPSGNKEFSRMNYSPDTLKEPDGLQIDKEKTSADNFIKPLPMIDSKSQKLTEEPNFKTSDETEEPCVGSSENAHVAQEPMETLTDDCTEENSANDGTTISFKNGKGAAESLVKATDTDHHLREPTDDSRLMNNQNNLPENEAENLNLETSENQTDEEKLQENKELKVTFKNESEVAPKSSGEFDDAIQDSASIENESGVTAKSSKRVVSTESRRTSGKLDIVIQDPTSIENEPEVTAKSYGELNDAKPDPASIENESEVTAKSSDRAVSLSTESREPSGVLDDVKPNPAGIENEAEVTPKSSERAVSTESRRTSGKLDIAIQDPADIENESEMTPKSSERAVSTKSRGTSGKLDDTIPDATSIENESEVTAKSYGELNDAKPDPASIENETEVTAKSSERAVSTKSRRTSGKLDDVKLDLTNIENESEVTAKSSERAVSTKSRGTSGKLDDAIPDPTSIEIESEVTAKSYGELNDAKPDPASIENETEVTAKSSERAVSTKSMGTPGKLDDAIPDPTSIEIESEVTAKSYGELNDAKPDPASIENETEETAKSYGELNDAKPDPAIIENESEVTAKSSERAVSTKSRGTTGKLDDAIPDPTSIEIESEVTAKSYGELNDAKPDPASIENETEETAKSSESPVSTKLRGTSGKLDDAIPDPNSIEIGSEVTAKSYGELNDAKPDPTSIENESEVTPKSSGQLNDAKPDPASIENESEVTPKSSERAMSTESRRTSGKLDDAKLDPTSIENESEVTAKSSDRAVSTKSRGTSKKLDDAIPDPTSIGNESEVTPKSYGELNHAKPDPASIEIESEVTAKSYGELNDAKPDPVSIKNESQVSAKSSERAVSTESRRTSGKLNDAIPDPNSIENESEVTPKSSGQLNDAKPDPASIENESEVTPKSSERAMSTESRRKSGKLDDAKLDPTSIENESEVTAKSSDRAVSTKSRGTSEKLDDAIPDPTSIGNESEVTPKSSGELNHAKPDPASIEIESEVTAKSYGELNDAKPDPASIENESEVSAKSSERAVSTKSRRTSGKLDDAIPDPTSIGNESEVTPKSSGELNHAKPDPASIEIESEVTAKSYGELNDAKPDPASIENKSEVSAKSSERAVSTKSRRTSGKLDDAIPDPTSIGNESEVTPKSSGELNHAKPDPASIEIESEVTAKSSERAVSTKSRRTSGKLDDAIPDPTSIENESEVTPNSSGELNDAKPDPASIENESEVTAKSSERAVSTKSRRTSGKLDDAIPDPTSIENESEVTPNSSGELNDAKPDPASIENESEVTAKSSERAVSTKSRRTSGKLDDAIPDPTSIENESEVTPKSSGELNDAKPDPASIENESEVTPKSSERAMSTESRRTSRKLDDAIPDPTSIENESEVTPNSSGELNDAKPDPASIENKSEVSAKSSERAVSTKSRRTSGKLDDAIPDPTSIGNESEVTPKSSGELNHAKPDPASIEIESEVTAKSYGELNDAKPDPASIEIESEVTAKSSERAVSTKSRRTSRKLDDAIPDPTSIENESEVTPNSSGELNDAKPDPASIENESEVTAKSSERAVSTKSRRTSGKLDDAIPDPTSIENESEVTPKSSGELNDAKPDPASIENESEVTPKSSERAMSSESRRTSGKLNDAIPDPTRIEIESEVTAKSYGELNDAKPDPARIENESEVTAKSSEKSVSTKSRKTSGKLDDAIPDATSIENESEVTPKSSGQLNDMKPDPASIENESEVTAKSYGELNDAKPDPASIEIESEVTAKSSERAVSTKSRRTSGKLDDAIPDPTSIENESEVTPKSSGELNDAKPDPASIENESEVTPKSSERAMSTESRRTSGKLNDAIPDPTRIEIESEVTAKSYGELNDAKPDPASIEIESEVTAKSSERAVSTKSRRTSRKLDDAIPDPTSIENESEVTPNSSGELNDAKPDPASIENESEVTAKSSERAVSTKSRRTSGKLDDAIPDPTSIENESEVTPKSSGELNDAKPDPASIENESEVTPKSSERAMSTESRRTSGKLNDAIPDPTRIEIESEVTAKSYGELNDAKPDPARIENESEVTAKSSEKSVSTKSRKTSGKLDDAIPDATSIENESEVTPKSSGQLNDMKPDPASIENESEVTAKSSGELNNAKPDPASIEIELEVTAKSSERAVSTESRRTSGKLNDAIPDPENESEVTAKSSERAVSTKSRRTSGKLDDAIPDPTSIGNESEVTPKSSGELNHAKPDPASIEIESEVTAKSYGELNDAKPDPASIENESEVSAKSSERAVSTKSRRTSGKLDDAIPDPTSIGNESEVTPKSSGELNHAKPDPASIEIESEVTAKSYGELNDTKPDPASIENESEVSAKSSDRAVSTKSRGTSEKLDDAIPDPTSIGNESEVTPKSSGELNHAKPDPTSIENESEVTPKSSERVVSTESRGTSGDDVKADSAGIENELEVTPKSSEKAVSTVSRRVSGELNEVKADPASIQESILSKSSQQYRTNRPLSSQARVGEEDKSSDRSPKQEMASSLRDNVNYSTANLPQEDLNYSNNIPINSGTIAGSYAVVDQDNVCDPHGMNNTREQPLQSNVITSPNKLTKDNAEDKQSIDYTNPDIAVADVEDSKNVTLPGIGSSPRKEIPTKPEVSIPSALLPSDEDYDQNTLTEMDRYNKWMMLPLSGHAKSLGDHVSTSGLLPSSLPEGGVIGKAEVPNGVAQEIQKAEGTIAMETFSGIPDGREPNSEEFVISRTTDDQKRSTSNGLPELNIPKENESNIAQSSQTQKHNLENISVTNESKPVGLIDSPTNVSNDGKQSENIINTIPLVPETKQTEDVEKLTDNQSTAHESSTFLEDDQREHTIKPTTANEPKHLLRKQSVSISPEQSKSNEKISNDLEMENSHRTESIGLEESNEYINQAQDRVKSAESTDHLENNDNKTVGSIIMRQVQEVPSSTTEKETRATKPSAINLSDLESQILVDTENSASALDTEVTKPLRKTISFHDKINKSTTQSITEAAAKTIQNEFHNYTGHTNHSHTDEASSCTNTQETAEPERKTSMTIVEPNNELEGRRDSKGIWYVGNEPIIPTVAEKQESLISPDTLIGEESLEDVKSKKLEILSRSESENLNETTANPDKTILHKVEKIETPSTKDDEQSGKTEADMSTSSAASDTSTPMCLTDISGIDKLNLVEISVNENTNGKSKIESSNSKKVETASTKDDEQSAKPVADMPISFEASGTALPVCPTDVSEPGKPSLVENSVNENTNGNPKIKSDSELSNSEKEEVPATKKDQQSAKAVAHMPTSAEASDVCLTDVSDPGTSDSVENPVNENSAVKSKTEPSNAEKVEAPTTKDDEQSVNLGTDLPTLPEAKVMSKIPIRQRSASKNVKEIPKRIRNRSEQSPDDNKAIISQDAVGKGNNDTDIENLNSDLPNPELDVTDKLQSPSAPQGHPKSAQIQNPSQDDSPRSDVENMDISIYGEDSLEAMYYSLKKHELLLDKMHKQASVCKSASKDRIKEDDVSESKEKPPNTETLEKSESLLPVDATIAEKSQREEPEDLIELPDEVAPIPVRKLSRNDSYYTACLTRPITSATILPRSKNELDSENPIELSKKRTEQFIQQLHAPSNEKYDSIDELADDEIRRNMLAYSISEADSDYYEPAERTNAILNDFNISTALENTPSTDTDSTIISAVTKIQAGARGFLTRRRLRRASVATTSFSDRKPSFGNAAIGESSEDLIDEEDAARRIQKSFRRYRNRKTRQSAPTLRNNITDSSSSKSWNNSSEEAPMQIIDVKLEQKSNVLSNISAKSDQIKEAVVGGAASDDVDSDEKAHEVDISLDGLNLAARRMTLQRGDAVQRNSTGEEESNSTSGNGSNDRPDEVSDTKTKLPRAKSSGTERNRTTSPTDRTAQLERMKRFTKRQRTMPVQIDFEILRVLPKHLRKRIRSADQDGKRKTDF